MKFVTVSDLPVLRFLYQAYAAYPEFLEIHWQAFRPAVQSRQFFLCGARLAAESYTRVHNYLMSTAWQRGSCIPIKGPGSHWLRCLIITSMPIHCCC